MRGEEGGGGGEEGGGGGEGGGEEEGEGEEPHLVEKANVSSMKLTWMEKTAENNKRDTF